MLRIDIIGIDSSTGGLILEADGRRSHGLCFATPRENVHWRVRRGSNVRQINAITWKPISGSTDVFSSEPPSAQNPGQTHWKGRVNRGAAYSIYVYSIEWVNEKDGTTNVFDPIISIKPSTTFADLIEDIETIEILAAINLAVSIVSLVLLATKLPDQKRINIK